MRNKIGKLEEAEPCFQTAISSYGVNIGFRADCLEGLNSIEQFLPFGCERSEADRPDIIFSVIKDSSGKFKLYAGARKVDESYVIEDIFLRFQSRSQLYIAAHTQQMAFIHAGVVAVGPKAIIIPGRSYTGKTTLVAEFIKAGAIYYSDEYAVLDAMGRAHPFPKPLSIRDITGKQRDVSAERMGARIGIDSAEVGLILVTKYKDGAEWRTKEADSVAGIKALTMNSISIRQAPELALRAIAKATSGALVLKSSRGDASYLVKDVMSKVQDWALI